jgi:hypothetical protein
MATKTKLLSPAFIKAITIFVAMIFILGGCNLLKKEVNPVSSVRINTNPSNPLIATVGENGKQFTELYGTKNKDGVVENINRIIIRENEDTNEADYLNFDEKSQLKSIYLKGGGKFTLNWKTDAKAVVTYLTADGQNQASAELDFDESEENERVVAPVKVKHYSSRSGMDMQLKQISSTTAQKTISNNLVGKSGLKELKVFVTQCGGMPADADQVSVIMYRYPHMPGDKRIGEFEGKRIAQGIYSVILPADQASTVSINKLDACKILAGKIGPIACSQTAKRLRKILKWGKVTVPSAVITTAVDKALEFVCEQIANNACEATFENKESIIYTGQLSFLAAVVPSSGAKVNYSHEKIIDGDSPSYPDLKAELGSEAKANTLTLTPDRPAAGQRYRATAAIACLPVNTIVTISVVGTDGYKNSKSLVVYNVDESGYFNIELSVPGGESGIQDVITLKATSPGGNTVNRSASLVFQ